MPTPIATKAICCHRDMPCQAPTTTAGSMMSKITTPRMTAARVGTSAGFTIQSMHAIAVKTIAMTANEPKRLIQQYKRLNLITL